MNKASQKSSRRKLKPITWHLDSYYILRFAQGESCHSITIKDGGLRFHPTDNPQIALTYELEGTALREHWESGIIRKATKKEVAKAFLTNNKYVN